MRFFCNSGLEANEAALKLARKYGNDKGIDQPQIVVYDKAFHGRSVRHLSATANPKVRHGFGALAGRLHPRQPKRLSPPSEEATEGNPDVVAVMMRAIQGEGGSAPMRKEYLQQVRALCDAKGWLMILDEVQVGMGRTGKWFAHQWAASCPT